MRYDTPRGCAAAYYPETNPLVPLDSTAIGSNCPTSKSIIVRLEPAGQQSTQRSAGAGAEGSPGAGADAAESDGDIKPAGADRSNQSPIQPSQLS